MPYSISQNNFLSLPARVANSALMRYFDDGQILINFPYFTPLLMNY